MKRIQVFVIALLLTITGLSIFAYKAFVLGFPLKPNAKSDSWTIEAKLKFAGGDRAVNLRFPLPQSTWRLAIVDENFVSDDYGQDLKREKKSGQRSVVWTKRKASGAQTLLYSAVLYELSSSSRDAKLPTPKVISKYSAKNRKVLKSSDPDPVAIALDQLIKDAKSRSTDQASLARELLKLLTNETDDRVKSLQLAKETLFDAIERAVFALKAAGIPARSVSGLKFEKSARNVGIQRWLEIFDNGQWRTATLKDGFEGEDAAPRLPWWRGTRGGPKLTEGPAPKATYSMRRNSVDAVTKALWRESTDAPALRALSLFDLPLQSQLVFRIMLLMPVGALIIAFFRQVIGLRTFGTFTPLLVALAFRETQLLNGLVMFTTVVALGLILRSLLDKLRLLAVPRLAAVLTIVVAALVFMAKMSQAFGWGTGLSLSLFPIVILTMLIERISVVWDENGARDAIIQGIGTMIMAVLCYLVVFQPLIGHFTFVFPELLMLVLALALLIGQYNGYKLSEYIRFRGLQKQLLAKAAQHKAGQ